KIWDVWASANTVFADLEGNGTCDLSDQKFSTWGFILGADARIGEHWIAGAFANYDRIWASLDKDGSRADIDAGGGGLYAGWHNGGWYGHGLFNYTHSWYDATRNIHVPLDFVFKDTQVSSPQSNTYGADIDGGYDWCVNPHFTIGLLAGLQYVHLNVDSFSEKEGENNTAFCPGGCAEIPGPSLAVDEQDLNSLRSRLGARATYHIWNCEGWAFAVEGRAAWQHEFLNDSRTISASLIGEGLPSFDVRTTAPHRDSALVGGGLNVTYRNRYTVFGDYDAQVGQDDFIAQSVKAGLKISF
ncbi:MAG: hypothetical protein DME35_04290, partial [Verrucomicrobia bacterium]